MTDKRKAYEEKFDAQLKEWRDQIVLYNAKADKTRGEAKVEYYKTIETLQGKQDSAKLKLQQLRAAGDDKWEDLKAGAEKVWADTKNAFERTAEKFERS